LFIRLISGTEIPNRREIAKSVSLFPTLYSVISFGFINTGVLFCLFCVLVVATGDAVGKVGRVSIAAPRGIRTESPTRRFFLLLAAMISLTGTPYMRLS